MLNAFKDITEAARREGSRRIVVPWPAEQDVAVLAEAAAAGLASPCLVGNGGRLKTLVDRSSLVAGTCVILEEDDPRQALLKAMAVVRSGDGDILMQGGAGKSDLFQALQEKDGGWLKPGGIFSLVSVFSLLKREKLILVTDTYINNHPTLVEKQRILGNALDLARLIGMESPMAAVLAAIEQVNPGIPSTLDAAVLSKMAERRQFGRAVVEGPLDIDCALSQVAAKRKGLQSAVTGNADIYLVPEIDTGLLLAEALVFFGRMKMAGVVMGTTRPVIVDLPFVSRENRVVEIALASLLCRIGGKDA